jgi:arabinogalactan oligomer/maltooligosaccharide transport system substrate-binding protein
MRRAVALLSASVLLAFSATLAPPARALDPTTVTIFSSFGSSGSGEADAFAQAVARVEADMPGVTIEAVDIPFGDLYGAYFWEAEGGWPDLLVAPNDALYWEWQAGYALDVRDAVLPARAAMRHGALVGSTVDGHLAQIPESLKAIALYYDRDALPDPPMTTSAMLAALEAGTRIGIVGGADPYYAFGFFGSFGGRIMDSTGTCIADQGPGAAMALAWLHDAFATGNLIPFANGFDAGAALESGDIDALFEGSWRYADLKAALGDRLAVVAGPKGPQGTLFRSMVGTDGYTVNPYGEKDLALAVALALTDRAAEQTYAELAGHIPADRTIRITDPGLRVFEKATKDGVLRPMNAELDNYWWTFGDALGRVAYGDEDAATVVAEACTAMNEANGR